MTLAYLAGLDWLWTILITIGFSFVMAFVCGYLDEKLR